MVSLGDSSFPCMQFPAYERVDLWMILDCEVGAVYVVVNDAGICKLIQGLGIVSVKSAAARKSQGNQSVNNHKAVISLQL